MQMWGSIKQIDKKGTPHVRFPYYLFLITSTPCVEASVDCCRYVSLCMVVFVGVDERIVDHVCAISPHLFTHTHILIHTHTHTQTCYHVIHKL